MDYPTRDRYRHAIEELAKTTHLSELDTAQRRRRRRSVARRRGDPRDAGDPGYLLIGAGRAQFERDIGYRPFLRQRFLRAYVAARYRVLSRQHRAAHCPDPVVAAVDEQPGRSGRRRPHRARRARGRPRFAAGGHA